MKYKILVERGSELHRIFIKYLKKINEVCLRQKSKDKRDEEAIQLIEQCHSIIKDTIAKDMEWTKWRISFDGNPSMQDVSLGKISVYVQELE